MKPVILLLTLAAVFWTPDLLVLGQGTPAEQHILQKLQSKDLKYDPRLRPINSSNPTDPLVVTVNLYLRLVDEVDDRNGEFSVQLTYRQNWIDERFTYPPANGGDLDYVTIVDPGQQFWKPDTFFTNEKTGKFHELTARNEYIRFKPNGEVTHSTRLSLRLFCPMDLRNFPFDTQICAIRLASYGFANHHVLYKWKDSDPIQVTYDLHVRQYALSQFTNEYCDSTTITGTYSCLRVNFHLARTFRPFLLQVFLPSTMLVIVSWLALWIGPEHVTARVLLTSLTLFVLSLYTAFINLTMVPVIRTYPTLLDNWTGTCLTFVFAALVQSIVVHVVSRRTLLTSNKREGDRDILLEDMGANSAPQSLRQRAEAATRTYLRCCGSGGDWAAKIDGVSRALFPLLFLLYVAIYWI